MRSSPRMERKTTKKTLSLNISLTCTFFRLCTNFSSAKCHNTSRHTRLYPDTWELLGLRFLSQNLIMIFSVKTYRTSFRLCTNFSSAKCPDTTGQTRPYLDTQGLQGL
jgi:hypothetical protein